MKTYKNFSENKLIQLKKILSCLTAAVIFITAAVSSITPVFADEKKEEKLEATVVMSASTGEIIYSMYEDRKLPVSDSVKLMVAMTVIDNMHDNKEFDNIVQITKDTDNYGNLFKEGENISVKDLMYAMLVANSDEAAHALALYTADSVAEFTGQMNAKAQQLGLVNTKYSNTVGEYSENQYSSAFDTAILMQNALRYKEIRKILSTKSYEISGEGVSEPKKLISADPVYNNKEALKSCKGFIGGIMGSTKEDGKNTVDYVGAATQDSMDIVVVKLQTGDNNIASEVSSLFNYGFKKATKKVIVKDGKKLGRVKVKHGEKTIVPVYTAGKGYVYIPPEGSKSLIKTETLIYDNIKAPLKKNTKVGEYKIYVADDYKGSVDLVIKENINKGWLPSYIYISNFGTIIILIVILAFIYIIVRIRIEKKRRKLMKKRKRQEKIREIARKQKAIEDDRKRRNWTYH